MTTYPEAPEIKQLVDAAQTIVIVQADNPDGDSLASALALEQILGDGGKQVYLYSGVDIPTYLRYMPGWDRVTNELPNRFDAGIIVDTSSDSLLEQLNRSGHKAWLVSKPVLVIDHHATLSSITYAKVASIHPAVATSEIIYEIARQLKWKINAAAKKFLAMGILSDSLGLTSEATTARSVHVIGELVEGGVDLAELENLRRQTMKREPELIHYKGRLLQRVEFHDNNRIATVTIPWEEIEKYSPLYNPSMLVIDDMRLGRETQIAIAFKLYPDGRVTVKIRANYGHAVADKIAEHFGGGGHPYASGFKVTDGRSYDQVKKETIEGAIKALDEQKVANEAL